MNPRRSGSLGERSDSETAVVVKPGNRPRHRHLRGGDGEFARWQQPTLSRAWPRERPRAAMCVRNVDDQGVLQFTLIHAVGCVLHRRGSRAIHRLQLFLVLLLACLER
jgi:hypothetical protein